MLIGRERELAELERVLACARGGQSAVLALVGEPGIGKTVLLEYAAGRAAGFRLLRARGVESEAQLPFSGLFELLRPALPLLGRIPAPQAAALERALALAPGAPGERFAVGAATLSLLAAYAEEAPALVIVDDAHLLDAATAEATRFALRRLLAEPLAALLAAREHEPSLLDDAGLPVLRLPGLDRTSSARLLGPVQPEVAERLFRATAGNPLALLELAADEAHLAVTLVDAPVPVPARIADVFLRRAADLDARARLLLVVLAASDSGDLPAVERAARSLGLDVSALAAAEGAGLVRVAGGRAEFRHPLARAAVYSGSPPEDRRRAHRALATALPDRDLDRRAWHLAAAAIGSDDAAAAALEQAGARARDRSGYAVAAAAFEQGARLAPDEDRRCRLLVASAEAAWLSGLAERAAGLLAEARPLAAGPRRLRIEYLRGQITARRGPVMAGHAILAAAAEEAAHDDPDLAVIMLAEAVVACFYSGDARAMTRAAQRLRTLLPGSASAQAQFLAGIAEGMAQVFSGDAQQGIDAIRRAVALAERSEELRGDEHMFYWQVMGVLWIREAGTGRRLIEAAIETARSRAALGILPRLLINLGRDHAAASDWRGAEISYDEAASLAREIGQRTELAAALAGLAWLEARKGQEAECRARAAEARTLCAQLGVGLFDTWAIRALGELELGLGRPAAAIEHLRELEQRLADLGIKDVDLSPAAELVDAYLRLGRAADAAAAAGQFATRARDKGQPWSLARAERCAGLLAADGDFDPHFAEALRLHAQTPDSFEAACTRLAYGARLRRARQRVRAREQLRQALEGFERLGAGPWFDLARNELSATGETAQRRSANTEDDLTHQELHIAQLLSAGKTTREAAAALFLSPKTIEYHLRHVYRKLGVGSRAELAQALAAARRRTEH